MPDDLTPSNFEKLTHGNYHSWELQASGKIKKAKVWRVVKGDDTKPPTPTPLGTTPTAQEQAMFALEKKAVRKWELNDDIASGILMELIAPDQECHVEGYTSSKDFWDRLKVVHQSVHAGITAF